MKNKALSISLYLVTALIGILALGYPFLVASISPSDLGEGSPLASGTPLLTTLLISLCLAVLLVELQGQAAGAKTVAALGIMVAATATLRFIEVGIPGPAGFSPIFAPIILGGYVFGARFGFLLGAMTMLVSAIITAGVGPWLPYQMFTAGWIGLSAGFLPHLNRNKAELGMLAGFAFIWGFAYGAVMNLYTWPYLGGDPATTWTAGIGLGDTVRRYAAFYVTTSLVWDSAAALGNVILMAALGLPTVRALTRFHGRMQYQVWQA